MRLPTVILASVGALAWIVLMFALWVALVRWAAG